MPVAAPFPADWKIVAPWTVHMHGKFYDIDESGDEPSVPVRDILQIFIEAGYTGYISSEWEAWHWNLTSDPWDMVARHHHLQRRVLAELLQTQAVTSPASERDR